MKITALTIFFLSFNVFSSIFLDGSWTGSGVIITKTPYGEIEKNCSSVFLDISQDKTKIDILKGQFECENSVSKSFNPAILDINENGEVSYRGSKVGELGETELNISFTTPSSNTNISFNAFLNSENQLEIIQKERTFFGLEIVSKATLVSDSAP